MACETTSLYPVVVHPTLEASSSIVNQRDALSEQDLFLRATRFYKKG